MTAGRPNIVLANVVLLPERRTGKAAHGRMVDTRGAYADLLVSQIEKNRQPPLEMICSNCQTVNQDDAKFCKECGQKLSLSCANCGHANEPGSKFCNNCGQRLVESGETRVESGRPGAATSEQPPTTGYRRPASGVQQPTTSGRPLATGERPLETGSQPQIERFVPRELAKKLEKVRSGRAMEGERRVVTMLFCDVTGSTATAEHLDPEEWTEIMNGAFEQMIAPIYKYEGTVGRLMGDAVLAFFGAPITHEDDPRRAVLAGLDIVTGIADYAQEVRGNWGVDFNVRVGINTGLVVVGAVGSDLRMEYTAMGDAINLAARMEQTAQPGTVQIAEDTFHLVAPLFETEALGGVEVKGKSEPVLSYRVLGRRKRPGRLRGIEGLESPLIGRKREFARIQAAVDALRRGVGGIIILVGEAGLGKSRLIDELKLEIRKANSEIEGPDSKISWFETASLSYESDQPYALFRRLIRRVIGSRPGDSPEALRATLRDVVEEAAAGTDAFSPAQAQRVFESIFGLTSESGVAPLEGETFKGMLYTLMGSLWKSRADRGPVVLVCDDLHWSDQASVDLLLHLFKTAEGGALLLVCALRPDREAPGWQVKQKVETDYPHRYTEINLQPLSAEDSGQLVDSLLTISELPARLRSNILDKSDGNPFFVEEVVRSLIDQGLVIRDESSARWLATGASEDIDIPDNLQTLLVARIDRLADDTRRTLQLASVVGRHFYYRILERIAGMAEEIDAHLTTLERAELIQEAARIPELEYAFRHVLTQEAAYSTILLKQRQAFHLRVGETIEKLFPGDKEELAPTLAHHFRQARAHGRALEYYVAAGDSAIRLHALREAIDHYTKGLVIASMEGLQYEGDLISTVKHLYLRKGRALELSYKYEEALALYQAMRQEAEKKGDRSLLLASLIAIGTIYSVGSSGLTNADLSREYSTLAMALAKEVGEREAEARILWNQMMIHHYALKENARAVSYGEASLAIARELGMKEHIAFTLNDLQRVYAELGDAEMARTASKEAQEGFREVGNLPMLSDNLTFSSYMRFFWGDIDGGRPLAEEVRQITRSIGHLFAEAAIVGLGYIPYRERGDYGAAFNCLEEFQQMLASEAPPLGFVEMGYSFEAWLFADLGMAEPGLLLHQRILERLDKMAILMGPETLEKGIRTRLHVASGDLDAAQEAFAGLDFDLATAGRTDLFAYELALTSMEYYLATEQFADLEEFAGEVIKIREESQVRFGLADAHFFRGIALLEQGDEAAAAASLEAGREVARAFGARRILWRILGAQAALADGGEAEVLRAQAREMIGYIAHHAGDKERQSAFLSLPYVISLINGA